MITCIFEHFTLHLRFTTLMRNTLRKGRKILNPLPTLIGHYASDKYSVFTSSKESR